MGILNVGTQALQANLVALQTIGNNIANVNTVGYSRQRVSMETVPGQYTGNGFVGKGVSIQTISRNYDEFLTRQSTLANSVQASDVTRADYLKQLSNIFQGGTSGVGAAINDMLNAFSDVASTPTDLTARTVALTRVDEAARRMRSASLSLDDLQAGITSALNEKVAAVNTLAQKIADVNGQVSTALGSGQTPNDLLDKRDQLIKELSQYVQTTTVPSDDGSLSVFIGGSQSLVLGSQPATVSLASNEFGDPMQNKLVVQRGATSVTMDENALGGGEISGLLRFQNTDLAEGRNLLGRLTVGITTAMNDQHKLGLDLDGNPGGNLFTPLSVDNVLPASTNGVSTASMQLSVADSTKLAASDYVVNISATGGTITRVSDGKQMADLSLTPLPVTFDGLTLTNLGGAANAGDRFYLKPYSNSASNVQREFASARALAVASSVVGQMGVNNAGSLQLNSLVARSDPASITNVPVTITFTGPNAYTRSDVAGSFVYTSGQPIEGSVPATNPLSQWTLKLQGAPKAGDTFTVSSISDPNIKLDPKLNGGNATALMAMRDVAMFDGAAMSDGYAGLISQIGIRTQSANYSAEVSTNLATSAEKDRTGVAGVNLDEEAGKLLQYQQAYQASAKMIQVAQSIFDTLFNTLMH